MGVWRLLISDIYTVDFVDITSSFYDRIIIFDLDRMKHVLKLTIKPLNHYLFSSHLCLRKVLISIGESLHIILNGSMLMQELDVATILLQATLLAHTDVLLATNRGETPVLGDDDLLATGELVGRATESLDGSGAVGVTGANRQENLADVHTGDEIVGLTEGSTHTGLETIGTSARKHLVDTDDMEGVGTDTKVETFFTGDLDEVPYYLLVLGR